MRYTETIIPKRLAVLRTNYLYDKSALYFIALAEGIDMDGRSGGRNRDKLITNMVNVSICILYVRFTEYKSSFWVFRHSKIIFGHARNGRRSYQKPL